MFSNVIQSAIKFLLFAKTAYATYVREVQPVNQNKARRRDSARKKHRITDFYMTATSDLWKTTAPPYVLVMGFLAAVD